MSTADFMSDEDKKILAQFALELESAAEPGDVFKRYCRAHPQLREQFIEHVLGQFALELESSQDPYEALQRRQRGFPELRHELHKHFLAWQSMLRLGVMDGSWKGVKLGRYTLGQRLGSGMDVVYEAMEDPPLERRVAVKILSPGGADTDTDRFMRQQELLARMNDHRIVSILESGQDRGLRFFAMPVIDGASLNHVVRAALAITTSQPRSTCPSVSHLAKLVQDKNSGDGGDKAAEQIADDGAQMSAGSTQFQSSRDGGPSKGPVTIETNRRGVVENPRRLSVVYFRSVAELMIDAATAVGHAHQIDILHRDIKPSNIMVTADGQCRLIDFGLGKRQQGNGQPESVTGTAQRTTVGGTAAYVPPEQVDGHADKRSDVFGLGATLFELLTHRPPFDADQDLRSRRPKRPRALVRNVPRDLEAICLKALEINPGERYQTAEVFAEDLRRWLGRRPSHAWPRGWPRRLFGPRSPRAAWLWCRRHRAAATAIAAIVIAVVAGFVFLENRAAADRRAKRLLELQQLRLTSHSAGWSEKAWTMAREIASAREDADVRDEAAATLIGWDATREKEFKNFAATSLAFSAEGTRLLMGGWTAPPDGESEPARLWDKTTGQLTVSEETGTGPVAFHPTGRALQLIVDPANRWRLVLWDVEAQRLVRGFVPTGQLPPGPTTPLILPVMALSADGRWVAAAWEYREGEKRISNVGLNPRYEVAADWENRNDENGEKLHHLAIVWEAGSGREAHRQETKATALAFSPDGQAFAAAEEGEIVIRSTATGEGSFRLPTGRSPIRSLAFGRDPRPLPETTPGIGRWRLAAGNSGGLITIWSLRDRSITGFCPGSSYDVTSVNFSGDGALLISSGRFEARLWDVANSKPLLRIQGHNYTPAAVFSPDVKQVAVCSTPAFGWEKEVVAWNLQRGRGIDTLHGLSYPIDKVCMSADGRFIAALAQDWQVGIWESSSGNLRHVLDVPQGAFTDNAALAFNAGGTLFAFSAGGRAAMYDVQTGQVKRQWPLPPGLVELLAFHASGALLSVRVETEGEILPPYGEVSWREHPRVIRVRNLLSQNYDEPVRVIPAFNRGVFHQWITPDGSYFVTEGTGGPNGDQRSIRAYKGLTGETAWNLSVNNPNPHAWFVGDPASQLVGLNPSADEAVVLRIADKSFHAVFPEGPENAPMAIGPGSDYRVRRGYAPRFGYSLRRGDSGAVLVVIGLDLESYTVQPSFNLSGTHFAWGGTDGTVYVANIRQVQRQLAQIGLGW